MMGIREYEVGSDSAVVALPSQDRVEPRTTKDGYISPPRSRTKYETIRRSRGRLTYFCGLRAYEGHQIYGDCVEVARLGVFLVNVPLDLAL